MAFVGTLFASLVAFPLCFVAARNITPNWLTNQGPSASSISCVRSTCSSGRCSSHAPSARDRLPACRRSSSPIPAPSASSIRRHWRNRRQAARRRPVCRRVAAAGAALRRAATSTTVFASQSLYFWEFNTRSATIIGAVGAGGIGLKLWEAMRTNQDWENVAYMGAADPGRGVRVRQRVQRAAPPPDGCFGVPRLRSQDWLATENSIRDAAKRLSENSTGIPAGSSLTATVTSTIEPGDSLRSSRSAASA